MDTTCLDNDLDQSSDNAFMDTNGPSNATVENGAMADDGASPPCTNAQIYDGNPVNPMLAQCNVSNPSSVNCAFSLPTAEVPVSVSEERSFRTVTYKRARPSIAEKSSTLNYYEPCSVPVIIKCADGRNHIGNMNHNAMEKEISTICGKLLAFQVKGPNELVVRVSSRHHATRLVGTSELCKTPVTAEIQKAFVKPMGYIDNVSVHITDDALLKSFSEYQVVAVRRYHYKTANGEITLKARVVLTFASFPMPQVVMLHGEQHPVIPYVTSPWQCEKCQRFGHRENTCRSTPRCAKCTGSHPTVECQSNTVKCCNCSKAHESTRHNCPVRIRKLQERKNFLHGCLGIAANNPKRTDHQIPQPLRAFSRATPYNPELTFASIVQGKRPTTPVQKQQETQIQSQSNRVSVVETEPAIYSWSLQISDSDEPTAATANPITKPTAAKPKTKKKVKKSQAKRGTSRNKPVVRNFNGSSQAPANIQPSTVPNKDNRNHRKLGKSGTKDTAKKYTPLQLSMDVLAAFLDFTTEDMALIKQLLCLLVALLKNKPAFLTKLVTALQETQ